MTTTKAELDQLEAELLNAKEAAHAAPDDSDARAAYTAAAEAVRAAREDWRAAEESAGRRVGPVGGDATPKRTNKPEDDL